MYLGKIHDRPIMLLNKLLAYKCILSNTIRRICILSTFFCSKHFQNLRACQAARSIVDSLCFMETISLPFQTLGELFPDLLSELKLLFTNRLISLTGFFSFNFRNCCYFVRNWQLKYSCLG